MVSAFPKATPAEAQDIWVVWRMRVDCEGCQHKTRRRRRLRTVYPCNGQSVIAYRGRWLTYLVLSLDMGATGAPAPAVVHVIVVSPPCAQRHPVAQAWEALFYPLQWPVLPYSWLSWNGVSSPALVWHIDPRPSDLG